VLHDEIDAAAALAASETMEETLGGRNREGGRFFVMKGAEANVVDAPLFQADKIAYHLLYSGGIRNVLNGFLPDHALYKNLAKLRIFIGIDVEKEKCHQITNTPISTKSKLKSRRV
jgi:hypothetical protein